MFDTPDHAAYYHPVASKPGSTSAVQKEPVNGNQLQTCVSCFVTSSYPGITFGDNGRCALCSREFKHTQPPRTISALRDVADGLKRRKEGKYDCLIGASGGLDSSYVILVAKNDLGLNPLVVRYDAGFSYELAEHNIERMCERLGVDLRIVRSPAKNDFKYIRSTVRALRNLDAYLGLCRFCTYMLPAVIHRCAVAERVPAILTSRNDFEDSLILPMDYKMRFMLNALRKRAWRLPSVLLHLTLARYYLLRLKLEFYVPPPRNLLRPKPLATNPVPQVCISDYVDWDIDHMVERLQREAGWRTSTHPNLGMRFDCKLEDSFVNHTRRKAYGLTVHAMIANNLIRCGVRTKADLAEVKDYYDQAIADTTEEVLRQLDLK